MLMRATLIDFVRRMQGLQIVFFVKGMLGLNAFRFGRGGPLQCPFVTGLDTLLHGPLCRIHVCLECALPELIEGMLLHVLCVEIMAIHLPHCL